MGMFPSAPAPEGPAARNETTTQKKTMKKKKQDDYEEVFDHLEEPDFDPEEMQRTAMLLRQRQQEGLAARQKQLYSEAATNMEDGDDTRKKRVPEDEVDY